jgi:hypothetical protein
LNEKEEIERAIAEPFVGLYNAEMKTTFEIVEHSDSPDIRCKDSGGDILNIEITLTEDQPRDIQAMLGRSEHKSVEALELHMAEVSAGRASPLEGVSCLQGNVSDMVVSRIRAKLTKDYGRSVALVIYDSSPLDWKWEHVADQVRSAVLSERNPFDRGIWILPNSRNRIIRIN